jgi:hypothetical protein
MTKEAEKKVKAYQLVSTILALALAPAVHAATGAGLLNTPLSVRQIGMGNVSLGGADVLKAWSNPAGLSGMEGKGVAAVNGAQIYDGDMTAFGGGAGYRLSDRLVIGALFSAYTSSFKEVGTDGSDLSTSFSRQLISGGIVGAMSFGLVKAGLTVKYVGDSLAGDSASAFAADLGLLAKWQGITAGLAVRNLGSGLRTAANAGGEAQSLPMEIRGGAVYTYTPLNLTGGAEVAMPTGSDMHIGIGLEWWPIYYFGLRAGLPGVTDSEMKIAGGFTAMIRGVALDYAISTHALGLTHRVCLSYAFGLPENAAVVEVASSERTGGAVAAPAGTKLNIAVAELTPQNMSAGDAAVVSDMIRSELVKKGTFNVIEKANMDKIMAEQAFQQTGCTDAECAVKLGKMLNVQRMVVGSFGKLMDAYFLNIRLIDVETGKTSFGDTAKMSSSSEVEKAVRDVVARMSKAAR